MEASLLVLCLSLYLNFFSNARIRKALVAFFPLIRPEAVVFMGIEGLSMLAKESFQPQALLRVTAKTLPLTIPLGISCFVGWLLFGEALPHSATNKLAQGASGWKSYASYLAGLGGECFASARNLSAALLAVAGVVYAVRKSSLAYLSLFAGIVLWQIGLVALQAPHYTWYSLSLHFGVFVSICLGIASMEGTLKRLISPRQLPSFQFLLPE